MLIKYEEENKIQPLNSLLSQQGNEYMSHHQNSSNKNISNLFQLSFINDDFISIQKDQYQQNNISALSPFNSISHLNNQNPLSNNTNSRLIDFSNAQQQQQQQQQEQQSNFLPNLSLPLQCISSVNQPTNNPLNQSNNNNSLKKDNESEPMLSIMSRLKSIELMHNQPTTFFPNFLIENMKTPLQLQLQQNNNNNNTINQNINTFATQMLQQNGNNQNASLNQNQIQNTVSNQDNNMNNLSFILQRNKFQHYQQIQYQQQLQQQLQQQQDQKTLQNQNQNFLFPMLSQFAIQQQQQQQQRDFQSMLIANQFNLQSPPSMALNNGQERIMKSIYNADNVKLEDIFSKQGQITASELLLNTSKNPFYLQLKKMQHQQQIRNSKKTAKQQRSQPKQKIKVDLKDNDNDKKYRNLVMRNVNRNFGAAIIVFIEFLLEKQNLTLPSNLPQNCQNSKSKKDIYICILNWLHQECHSMRSFQGYRQLWEDNVYGRHFRKICLLFFGKSFAKIYISFSRLKNDYKSVYHEKVLNFYQGALDPSSF